MDIECSVVCPACGHSRRVARAALPPRPVHATCPHCGSRFPFAAHLEEPAAAPPLADPPPAAPPPPLNPEEFVSHRFVFSGTAREYFGIWIVNLLLKIVTFGVYSAWAKVRSRRYLYGNTHLGGSPFDYTADPLAIFKGWLIAAAVFAVYSLGSRISPLLGTVFGLLFYLAVPWLVVRSRMFSLRNSVHRNIRCSFRPDYREAYLVFAGLPLLIPLTFGAIIPYLVYRQKKFLVDNSSYGDLNFAFLAAPGDFYRFFFKVGLGLVAILGGIVALALACGVTAGKVGAAVLAPLFLLAIAALYFFAAIYVQTGLSNLTWNATFLGEAWFTSSLRTRDMAWLYLSNAVAIVLSLGLLIPWATVRMAHYRCACMEFTAPEDLQVFAVQQAAVGAGGEEIGDLFGVDVGL